jgi:hypothetical protein
MHSSLVISIGRSRLSTGLQMARGAFYRYIAALDHFCLSRAKQEWSLRSDAIIDESDSAQATNWK